MEMKYFSEDAVFIGAECPVCGTVLRIKKTSLLEEEGYFLITNGILCGCNRKYKKIIIYKRRNTCTQSMAPTGTGRILKKSKEQLLDSLNAKLVELQEAKMILEEDSDYWRSHPSQAEPMWWRGHYDNIARLENEIESLKKLL